MRNRFTLARVALPAMEEQCLADAALRSAVGCWFFVTLIGQWLFMYYVAALYGASTVTGHFEDWAKKTTLFKGYIPGDAVGNLAFAAHVLLAAVVSHDIDAHRRWALRTFMVVNGSGYFIRVAFAGWSVFAAGAGTGNADGPMYYFFAFGAYLLPLAILEVYLRVRAGGGTVARFATALMIVAFTAYLTAGTLAATMARRHLVG